MSNQKRNNTEKQKGRSTNNEQGLTKAPVDDALGYGDMDPNAKVLSNMTNNTNQ